jgi:hypothetical protein
MRRARCTAALSSTLGAIERLAQQLRAARSSLRTANLRQSSPRFPNSRHDLHKRCSSHGFVYFKAETRKVFKTRSRLRALSTQAAPPSSAATFAGAPRAISIKEKEAQRVSKTNNEKQRKAKELRKCTASCAQAVWLAVRSLPTQI